MICRDRSNFRACTVFGTLVALASDGFHRFFALRVVWGFGMRFALLFESGVLAALGLSATAGPWADSHTPPAKSITLAGRQETFRSDANIGRRDTVAPRRPLRGDFPEYRPGFRAAGKETFWR